MVSINDISITVEEVFIKLAEKWLDHRLISIKFEDFIINLSGLGGFR